MVQNHASRPHQNRFSDVVTFVIPVWNSAQDLPSCIESLLHQTDHRWEAVFIDNASTDQSATILADQVGRDARLAVVTNQTNRGYCGAINQGCADACGALVAFMNPDIRLTPTYLEQARRAFEDPRVGTVAAKLLDPTHEGRFDSTGLFLDPCRRAFDRGQLTVDHGQYDRQEPVFAAPGALALHRMAMLRDVAVQGEPLDETFFAYYDDVDLGWRAAMMGWTTVYRPDAVAYHARGGANRIRCRADRAPSLNAQTMMIRNRYLMMLQNDSLGGWLRDFPWIAGYEIARFMYVALRYPRALQGMVQALRLLPRALVKRRIIQSRRRVRDDRLLPWFRFRGHRSGRLLTERPTVLQVIDKPMHGGGQHNVYLLATHLDAGQFVSMVACSPGGPLVDRCQARNIPVHPLSINKRFSPLSLYRLWALIRSQDVSLLHAHGLVALTFGALAARAVGIPIVYSQHGYHERNYREGIVRQARMWVERRLIRLVALTVCDSQLDRQTGIRRAYFNRAHSATIHPPVDLDTFRMVQQEETGALAGSLGLNDGHLIIGTVGRLDVAKGHDGLIAAIDIVRHHTPHVRCLIVGEGDQRNLLERLIRERKLSEHIRLLGSQPDILPYLALFQLFVSSSFWEGLPLALCEAMAMGKPVVATNVGGCPEVVKDGETGLLVPAGSPDLLAKAIISALEDKSCLTEWGREGRRRVEAIFSAKQVVRRLEVEYWQILSGAPRLGDEALPW